jgi:hypothetical protein
VQSPWNSQCLSPGVAQIKKSHGALCINTHFYDHNDMAMQVLDEGSSIFVPMTFVGCLLARTRLKGGVQTFAASLQMALLSLRRCHEV